MEEEMTQSVYARRHYERNREAILEKVHRAYLADPEGKKAATNAYRQANPERVRRWHLKANYGITPEDHALILADQGGGCAICKTPLDLTTGHVDHDHETEGIRGILCGPCNRGIGHLGDDADRVRSAADYLARWSRKPAPKNKEA